MLAPMMLPRPDACPGACPIEGAPDARRFPWWRLAATIGALWLLLALMVLLAPSARGWGLLSGA
jgi:hypothetical protein